MDSLDKFIHRCAEALHEAGRQRAVQKRHERDREAKIRVALETLEDRILLHFPPTKRESRLDLNDEQFKRLQEAEAGHRLQLLLAVVSMAGIAGDEPESDLNF
jgi:hypothetical protein